MVSLSNGIVVALLMKDDDVGCRDRIGGSINRLFCGAILLASKSSLVGMIKSSNVLCRAED